MRRPLLLVAILSSVSAFAQSAEVTKYLQATITLYENLEYAKALAQVQKAKTKAKTPDDEARCSVMEAIVLADMGKDDKASKAFQEAFALDPDLKLPVAVAPKISALAEKNREQVKKMLGPSLAVKKAEEEQRLAEERAKADAAKAEEAKAQEAKRLAEAAKAEEERRKNMQPPPAVVKPGPSLRSYAWIPGAVGLVGAAAGTVAFIMASGRYNALVANPPMLTPAEAIAARDNGKLFTTLGWVFSGVAVAGLGAAAVMFLIGKPSEPAPVAIVVTPSGAAVTVSGRFDVFEVIR
jgi:tetratricopeptide (TPR) repeat protein